LKIRAEPVFNVGETPHSSEREDPDRKVRIERSFRRVY
jgi:hypothetical protein